MHYDWPAKEGRTPFEHQKTTTKFMLQHKRGFILNEMGTGKTMAVLWFTDLLLRAGKINKVLIIGPISTMRSVWAKEIFENFPTVDYGIAHGNADYRRRIFNDPRCRYVITNHDAVRNFSDDIIAAGFDVIIVDEMTAFKSHNSERSKKMMEIAKKVKSVWALTGEPTPNSPEEAFMQSKIVFPVHPNRPAYFTAYRNATMTQINDYMWVPKPEAPNIVAAILQPSIRFTRDECLDLPETMVQTIDVPFTKEQSDAYERLRKELVLLTESEQLITAQSAAIALNKLLQISAGSVKTVDGEIYQIDCQPRLDAMFEIYEQTPQKKLVIFATYVATIERLVEYFNSKKVNVAAIYGQIEQKQRARSIEEFQTGDLNVLVMQPQSSAHGITLTAANTILWYSLLPSNELYNQGNARIVRPGQTRKTLIIRFVSSKAEQHIASILERKAGMSNEVLSLLKNKDF